MQLLRVDFFSFFGSLRVSVAVDFIIKLLLTWVHLLRDETLDRFPDDGGVGHPFVLQLGKLEIFLVQRNLKIRLYCLARCRVHHVTERLVFEGHVEGVRVEDYVVDHAPGPLVVHVLPRGCQRVGQRPLQPLGALFARGRRRGLLDVLVGANIYETLFTSVNTALDDITWFGVDEGDVITPFLLQLDDLLFVELLVGRVLYFFDVIDEEFPEFFLL
jgi:hypothetical protein